MTNTQLIEAWYQANDELQAAKEKEMELRMQVAESVFKYDPGELPSGTVRQDLGEGYQLKATFKVNQKLDEKLIPEVLQELENLGVGQEVRDSLFRYKPSLVARVQKMLDKQAQEILALAITKTSGTPSLAIESKKGK